jgi:hypothetical protein
MTRGTLISGFEQLVTARCGSSLETTTGGRPRLFAGERRTDRGAGCIVPNADRDRTIVSRVRTIDLSAGLRID